ncbi:MAG: TAT-variant-translocated molybdopterin oxidoreductase [Bacteroidota bacterium]
MKDNKNNGAWIGLQDQNRDPEFLESVKSEFTELPVIDSLSKEKSLELTSNRRDFLKYLGFGLGAATIAAGCDAPIRRAIPYVVKPDDIVPGVATYYATSFVSGGDYAAVLVRTREGRPIKIEGNKLSTVTGGGTDSRAQASVLDLYDTNRLRGPVSIEDGSATLIDWDAIDSTVKEKLTANAQIRIVCNTVLSPSVRNAFEEFKAKYPNTEIVTYDPNSSSAMLQANEACFGEKAIPDYRFQNADVIASFDADFLGTWISPTEYSRQYVKNRKVGRKNRKMSRHIHIESNMSITGSNADNRIMVKPSEQGAAIAILHDEIAKAVGATTVNDSKLQVNERAKRNLGLLAKELLSHKGNSLVISGGNNVGEQILVNHINYMLNNYGSTIDFTHASMQRQGLDENMQNLIREMNGGNVDVLFVYGNANPAYDLPNSSEFIAGLEKVGLSVSFTGMINDTAALCNYVAPTSHYLESWGDVEVKKGYYSLIQPTINRLFDTRQAEESLLLWAESSAMNAKDEQPYYDYLKGFWERNMFPKQTNFARFQSFWDVVLHDGVFEIPLNQKVVTAFNANIREAGSKISPPSNSEFELSLYETLNIGCGEYANNPWLQELPDPINRCVWGNYLSVPVEWDGSKTLGIKGIGAKNGKSTGDFVDLSVGESVERVSAIPQYGQMAGTLSIGLGYGRQSIGPTGANIGTNVYPWTSFDKNGNVQYFVADDVRLSEIVGPDEQLACVQYHHTMGVTSKVEGSDEIINVDEAELGYQGSLLDRTIIYQGDVKDFDELAERIHEKRSEAKKLNDQTLYPFKEYQENVYSQGHHWGMHIDLNACVGCGACVVACQSENNIPVVGKNEVHRHHEMSWLRIDRYFYGDVENPRAVYQPMMCQHCDNAPCENVCPVAATNHSSEGLNQMTYNRCIGTRYCANNCPYKVRRFNWLDYTTADLFPGNQYNVNEEEIPFGADNLTRMVLNPDVTVRSRGVIEKCSFCVQRIQEGKLTAKREGRRLQDSDLRLACQSSCATDAIVFGDMNDKNSAVSKAIREDVLNYRVLEEINVQTSVYYRAKVSNRDENYDV